MPSFNTTLVSAYLPIEGYNTKSIDDFIKYAEPFLRLPIPKVIFIDERFYEILKMVDATYTKYVPITKEDLLLHHKFANASLPNHRNLKKDVNDYFLVINSKPKFLKMASAIDPFETQQFLWVDFGISHVLSNTNVLNSLVRNYDFGNNLTIAGIWNHDVDIDIKNNVCWVFAGGVFGGTKSAVNKFYGACVSQLLDNSSKDFLTWEVNVWYQIYKRNKELFNVYYGSHDDTIITNIP